MSSSSTNTKVLVKKAVADIIKTVLPNAVVYNWWVIGKGIGASIGELETTKDATFVTLGTKFVHGYCVGISTLGRDYAAMNKKFNDVVGIKVWGFYQYVTGVRNKNSEDEFITNLEIIQDALSNSPKLIYNNEYEGIENVKGHNQLRFDDEIETYGFGGETKVWIARGNLQVDVTTQLV